MTLTDIFYYAKTWLPIIVLVGLIWLIGSFFYFGGPAEVKKMWLHTTKNPATNIYSQKRLMMWPAFWLGMFICFTQAFTIKLYPAQEFNSKEEAPMWVVIILFAFALGVSGAVLLGHLNARRTADAKGNPLEPAYKIKPTAKPLNPEPDPDLDDVVIPGVNE